MSKEGSRSVQWRGRGCRGVALALAAAMIPVAGMGADTGSAQTAGERFKNVQVLKEIPADQLVPSMEFVASSLGVDCGYCHVKPFDKDDKRPKATARKMMAMVLSLNKGSFQGKREVTCYTCHRGSPKPMAVPVIPEPGAPGQEPASLGLTGGDNLPSAAEIVARYTAAIGGTAAVGSLKTRVAKGTLESEDGRGDLEETSAAPDHFLQAYHSQDGIFSLGFDGTVAWHQGPDGRVREGNPKEARHTSEFFRTLDLKRTYKILRVEGKGTVGGRPALVVAGERSDGSGIERLYFDGESALLVRVLSFTDSALGINPEEQDFSDYRDAGGVKVPFTVRTAGPRESSTVRYSRIQFNAPVDEGKFGRPAATAPAAPKP